jgi:hypothetical protein
MLISQTQILMNRLTTENLAEMLSILSWCIKEHINRNPHAEFFCPEGIQARWFEDEVNNLLLDQQLDLIKYLSDQIKTNRQQ